MSLPDIIYYINLSHRKDRNDRFLCEMEKIHIPGVKPERQEAVYTPEDGALGCALSHIAVLKKFLESTHESALILEDDFEWTTTQEELNTFLSKLKKIPFDVCLLAGNIREAQSTQYPFLQKALFVSTTSAYIITRQYAKVLLENFKEAYQYRKTFNEDLCLPQNGDWYRKDFFSIDCHWTKLQKRDIWYIANPKLGKQRSDYSDIEKKVVDYNC